PNEAKIKMLNDWLSTLGGRFADYETLTYRAEINRMLGNLDQALADIKEPIEYNSEDYIALRVRANIYKMQGKYQLAIEDYDEVILNTYDLNCKLDRIESLYLWGKYEDAIKYIRELRYVGNGEWIEECASKLITVLDLKIQSQPDNASLYVFRALARNINEEYSEGFADFTRAHHINSQDHNLLESLKKFSSSHQSADSPELLAYCGEAYRLLNEMDAAIECCSQSLSFKPNDIAKNVLSKISMSDVPSLKAKVSLVLSDYHAALQSYEEATRLEPNNEHFHVMRFYLYLKLGRQAEILHEISQFINRYPENLECIKIRAEIRLHMGDYTGVIEDLEKYLDENPDDAFALLWNSVAKAKTNNLIDGVNDYVSSLRKINKDKYSRTDRLEYLTQVQALKPPTSYKTHVWLGQMLFKLRKYKEVLDKINLAKLIKPSIGEGISDESFVIQDIVEHKCWERYIEEDDQDTSYLGLEAIRLANYDNYSDFEENLENEPNNVFLLSRMAEIKRTDKDYVEAQSYFEKVLAIEPNHIFSLCRLAEILQRNKEYDQALSRLNQVLESNDEETRSFCLAKRASIKMIKGEFDSALDDLKLCINIEPGNYHNWVMIGDIKYTLELYEEALENYKNATQISKPNSYLKDRIKQVENKIDQAREAKLATNMHDIGEPDEEKSQNSSTSQAISQQQTTTKPDEIGSKQNHKRKYRATLFENSNNTAPQPTNTAISYKTKLRSNNKTA
ncbi:MAG TPA: tetratricopeptide repeat protein, partial [Gammaproteobacteria bacterium]|nr:tetratricopeptide repeat protein [Gammaproteobacteria bacterium]